MALSIADLCDNARFAAKLVRIVLAGPGARAGDERDRRERLGGAAANQYRSSTGPSDDIEMEYETDEYVTGTSKRPRTAR